ncbi:mitogen-activated serine/threonine-protein kinase KSS1 KNAG_0D03980 [Huiozyma naganishii CBS 8797]|uniref:Mitogen-activated protein kinase n=1 Tax=Huiozyma naganishii (strain ATCC MYA-139 / BCRC 22969 / CBS 8797 / KCTC 17520 / NBRC 10181 / NCYC 3082 / Yp74L-3) TaxID=1071383 RepID=J7S618_HUIN7|nr:hypothetical protein KNAG_0D03980 [Kazachstania naganishii CBS 8797]CCK70144.1 hypothetical protein KNAG_0D03980 [Kazachstania naganishii CBS 8797]
MSRTITFDIPSSYKLIDLIGEGAYGTVCSALHKPSQVKVAIKKIQPFSKRMFVTRTLREIKLLRFFHAHENIISILDQVTPQTVQELQAVYIVQELMETDLHRVLAAQRLSDDHIQYFVYQTLRALKAIHSAGVIHRDIKPSNLLLNSNCDLKVCDFGLARCLQSSSASRETMFGFMTEYVATRWYRAPEIMLSFQEYTTAMDIWSVGCILAEMLLGRPLFPGRDYHHQLWLILEILGTPHPADFDQIKSRRAREYIAGMPLRQRKPWDLVFSRPIDTSLLDLLTRMLTFNPDNRITAHEALEHAYLAPYHDPTDEPAYQPLDVETDAFWKMDNNIEAAVTSTVQDDEDADEDDATMHTLKRLLFEELHKPLL